MTPGAGDDAVVLSAPVDMHTLLDADFWDGILFEDHSICRQPCSSRWGDGSDTLCI